MTVVNPNGFKNMNSLATLTIGSAVGGANLFRVIINKVGITGNTLTIYGGQDATAPVIGVIDTTIATAPTRDYAGLRSPNGFTFVMATGTAADITIVYE